MQVVNGSLATPFQSRLANKIDVIVFNPPYVPTFEEEASNAQLSGTIGGAWAGGENGMQITNVLLRQIAVCQFKFCTYPVLTKMFGQSLLSSVGRFYLVAVKQNNIPQIIQTMQDKYRLTGEVDTILTFFLLGSHLFYR